MTDPHLELAVTNLLYLGVGLVLSCFFWQSMALAGPGGAYAGADPPDGAAALR